MLQFGAEDAALLERIRDATRSGRPVGSSDFVGQVEGLLQRSLVPRKRGPRAKRIDPTTQLEFGS